MHTGGQTGGQTGGLQNLSGPCLRRGGGVERGCVTFEFPGRFGRLFIISLASKEQIPKQLKQGSIVGSKINQGSCTIMYLRKILIVSNVEQSSLIMNVRPCNPNINQIDTRADTISKTNIVII